MIVAPGIAARVAARLATTPGGRPDGSPGMPSPAAAAGIDGVVAGLGLAAAPPPPAAGAAAAGVGEPPPPRAARPARLVPARPAAAMPVYPPPSEPPVRNIGVALGNMAATCRTAGERPQLGGTESPPTLAE